VARAASLPQPNVGEFEGRLAGNTSTNIMNDITKEHSNNLIEWLELEVRIDHYDPTTTPPRAPYSLNDLRCELARRLAVYDSIGL
jgi:hypothetical protein